MEFLENGATCNTSLINKRTSFIVSKTHTGPHYIHKRRAESYFLPQVEGLKKKQEPSNNVQRVYSVECVFLRRLQKSFY